MMMTVAVMIATIAMIVIIVTGAMTATIVMKITTAATAGGAGIAIAGMNGIGITALPCAANQPVTRAGKPWRFPVWGSDRCLAEFLPRDGVAGG